MFKVNNKDTRATPVLVPLLLTLNTFPTCSSVSIVNFKHAITVWVERYFDFRFFQMFALNVKTFARNTVSNSKLSQNQFYIKTSKSEWTIDNIRIEKIISAPIWEGSSSTRC